MKQIAIVSLHQNLSDYIDMLTLLRCSFRVIRCTDSLPPLCDGLLLPGGRDCSPLLYGQKNNGSRNVCIEEDLLQLSALEQYIHAERPVLGIDKGMQLINIAFGGSLRQHIGHYPHDAVRLGVLVFDRYHSTTLREGSMLEALYGASLIVNSSHHQAIDRLGRDLEITQFAYDGCPEAVQHRTLPVIGVQWHPERLLPDKDCRLHASPFPVQKPNETGCLSAPADGSLLFRLFLALS